MYIFCELQFYTTVVANNLIIGLKLTQMGFNLPAKSILLSDKSIYRSVSNVIIKMYENKDFYIIS